MSQVTKASRVAIGCLLVGFAVLDLLAPIALERSNGGLNLILLPGAMAGQSAMLLVWGVFGPHKAAARLAMAPLAAAALYGTVAGLGVADRFFGNWGLLPDLASRSAALPMLLGAIAIPLAIAKLGWGWHIGPPNERDASARTQQFGLRHVLMITGAVAVALGAARWSLAEEFEQEGVAGIAVDLLVLCLVTGAWSALFTLPTTWIVLATRDAVGGVYLLGLYAAVATLIAAQAAQFSIFRDLKFWEGYVVILLFNGGLLGVIAGCLLLVRRAGWVLHTRRRTASLVAPE